MIGRFGNESGYSLIEVLVAIVILAVAILPMVGMFDAGLRASVVGSKYDRARVLANENIEKVRALEYEEARDDYPPNGTPVSGTEGIFDYEVDTEYAKLDGGEVIEDSGARGMMKVTVTVEWEDKSYTTSGLVTEG
ncbi:MAG: prepilin-type N-terminal cleavage/methylation domain-containing protein [Rubrobacteraceae bacterium]